MAYDGLITSFLGQGLAADRPASLTIHPEALGLYWAIDTNEYSAWVAGAWLDDILGGLGVSFASAAEIRTMTEAAKAIAPAGLAASAAFQTLTPGATVAWDMASGYNAKVTLGSAANAIQAPSNPKEGLTYTLQLIQDGTGGRTVSWNAAFGFGSVGTPTLSTAAGKIDVVSLLCLDAAAPSFRAVFSKAS